MRIDLKRYRWVVTATSTVVHIARTHEVALCNQLNVYDIKSKVINLPVCNQCKRKYDKLEGELK